MQKDEPKIKAKEYEYCLKCGRKLKDPEARKIGVGKTCYKKYATILFDNKPLF